MLPKEELLRNIDELYRAYLSAEAERNRLKSLNSALRNEIAKLHKPRENSALNEKLRAENEALKSKLEAEIDTLKKNLISPISELPREFLSINDNANTGGIVDGFWQQYIQTFKLGRKAGKTRTYDLYIGYLFERSGFSVEYCGITNGVYDDGMDLICRKGSRVILIRCKEEEISKTAMYYLAARALRFKMDYPGLEVSALCVTSDKKLSGEAEIIAQKFHIAVKNDMPFKNFPYVKCKVFKNENKGERKVYYTPKHRDYITVKIIPENGDMFCSTEIEAAEKGFKTP